MKKRIIAINGEAWCRNLTGIERLAKEVTEYLDALVAPDCMELVVPANAKNLPTLTHIRTVILPQEAHFMPAWTQGAFQRYVLKRHAISLNYANTCPLFNPGVSFIHDIYGTLYKDDFTSRRDKLIRFYSTLMYRVIARHAKKVLTVSAYTKQTIVDTYHIKAERIAVVYSGVSAYRTMLPDDSVFARLPNLADQPFYFTLGSLSSRKNLAWIAKHAAQYPHETFAISGKPLTNALVPPELEQLKTLPNIVMTGYLSDAEVKALMTRCKAFILPSYFEGFGLPPLEALSCGAPIIVSDRTSLPEIYGDCAHYINPDDPTTDLDELLSQLVAPPESILQKFTLQNTAARIYQVLKAEGILPAD